MLVDLGVPWKDGVAGGDEGQDQEVEGVVANGVQQSEKEGAGQWGPRAASGAACPKDAEQRR